MPNIKPLIKKCSCNSCNLVKKSQNNASKPVAHSSTLLSSQDTLNMGQDESDDFTTSIYIHVYESGKTPYEAVRCQLHSQDLQCMGSLLHSVTAVLRPKHGSVKRLISKSGKEVKYPHDIISDEVYEAILFGLEPFGTDATPKRIPTVKAAVDNSALDAREHNESQKDYIRVFVFRPYIPVYLRKSDLSSYGDVLESISWYYGFPIQSVHHLDGMEVRSPDEMVAENVYIAVDNSPNCEYFNKSGQSKGTGSADNFFCDGMPCSTYGNVGSCTDLKPVQSVTGKCPAAEDYETKSTDHMSYRPSIDRHIFVRNLYSYKGNLQPTLCGLIKNDLSSMPHLLNILSAMIHPPGHYFTRLFDKNRKEVKDSRKIRSGREYLALSHIVSHQGWNYLQGVAPKLGWGWNRSLSSSAAFLSLSDMSISKSDPDEDSLGTRNHISSPGTSIYDLGHLSIHDLQRKTSDQIKNRPFLRDAPSSIEMPRTVSLPAQNCYSEGSSKETNCGAVGKCPHTGQDMSGMHEIIPSAILAAMTDYAAHLHSLHTIPESGPIVLNASYVSLCNPDSVGSERKQDSSLDRLPNSRAIKSADSESSEDFADDECGDDTSMDLYDKETPHPVYSVLDSLSDDTILKRVQGNSPSFMGSRRTPRILEPIESPRSSDGSQEILWTRDEGEPTTSEATAKDPSLHSISIKCDGPEDECLDQRHNHFHCNSQLLTAPKHLHKIYVYLDTMSAPVGCHLTDDDLISIQAVIDAISRHAFLEPGIIIGLNNLQDEPITMTSEINDEEYYIAVIDPTCSVDNLSPHYEKPGRRSERKPSSPGSPGNDKEKKVCFVNAAHTVIPPFKSSEPTDISNRTSNSQPSSVSNDMLQCSHIFITLEDKASTSEIVFNNEHFSWPNLMFDITSTVSPDDEVELLRSSDGKIVSSLDDVVNGCLYVAVPKSSSSLDRSEEDQKLFDVKASPEVPVVEETVVKKHVEPLEASPAALDEVFRNLLKSIIASTPSPRTHPTNGASEQATSSHGFKPTQLVRPNHSASNEFQTTKEKNREPNIDRATGSVAQMQDSLSEAPTRESSTTSNNSVAGHTARYLEDDTTSTGTGTSSTEDIPLAPSLINMAHLITKLLEIVVELMRQEYLRENDLEES